jgi:release factor glutamine methyltransferase
MTDETAVVARLRAAGCVFAEDEARLLQAAAPDAVALRALVDRRVAGEPLEHLLGWARFRGLRIQVDPGVFVPRRRTEFLVSEAVRVCRPGALVVDLCCGSGAVGAALLAEVPGIELHAADVDPAAVVCAGRNLPGRPVHLGDLFDALPAGLRGRVDVLVANVPYVPTDAIALTPPEARLHEPAVALDGGGDGLEVARRVLADAPSWLAAGGAVLFEAGEDQVPAALAAVAAAGLTASVAEDDDRGATVVLGTNS